MEALSKLAKDRPAKINKLTIIILSPKIKIVFLPNFVKINPDIKGATNSAPPTPHDIYNPLS